MLPIRRTKSDLPEFNPQQVCYSAAILVHTDLSCSLRFPHAAPSNFYAVVLRLTGFCAGAVGGSSFVIINVSDSFAFFFAFFFGADFAIMILQAECAGHAIPDGPGRQGI